MTCNLQGRAYDVLLPNFTSLVTERTDLKAKYVKMNLGDFYRKYLDQDKFPNLNKFQDKFPNLNMASRMTLFGSTYLCEQFFSKMGFMKFSYRSVMTGEHLENRLRIASTSIKVNLNRVVQKKTSCIFLTELFLQRLNRIAML